MRVPSNRAGMSARCPGCKAVVVIPFPPSDYQPSEVLDAVHASSAISSSRADTPNDDESPVEASVKKSKSRKTESKPPAPIEGKPSTPERPVTEKSETSISENSEPEKSPLMKPVESKPIAAKPVAEKSAVEETPSTKPEIDSFSNPKTKTDRTSKEKNKRKQASAKEKAKNTQPGSKVPTSAENPRPGKVKRRKKKVTKPIQESKPKTPSVPDLAAAKQENANPIPATPVKKVEPALPIPTAEIKKPAETPKVRESNPLDGVFSAFESASLDDKSSMTPDVPMNGNRSAAEPTNQPSDILRGLAKQASELPTVEPVNRVEEQVKVSAAKESSIDPEAFRFESTSSAESSFEPDNSTADKMSAIEIRTRRANADRVTLTRFFAAMLVFVGLVNFAPAIYCWYTWSQVDIDFLLPRWIYLQIFIAVLHLVYAVLLIQVPDWSTLRSIAVVMLAFAFVFGLFSMGLLTTGGNGLLAQFLQVPDSLGRQACIWCVAMLCLATLASYLAGRESNNWQRTERLLAEILANKEAV